MESHIHLSELLAKPGDGDVYLIGERQGQVNIKIDRRCKGVRSMSLITEDIKPGDRIPVHKHGAEDELTYIEGGSGILTFGDSDIRVSPAYMALVPLGVWHGLRNDGDEILTVVVAYTPAGFEDYFRAIGVRPGEPWKGLTHADWVRINSDFNVIYRD